MLSVDDWERLDQESQRTLVKQSLDSVERQLQLIEADRGTASRNFFRNDFNNKLFKIMLILITVAIGIINAYSLKYRVFLGWDVDFAIITVFLAILASGIASLDSFLGYSNKRNIQQDTFSALTSVRNRARDRLASINLPGSSDYIIYAKARELSKGLTDDWNEARSVGTERPNKGSDTQHSQSTH